MEPTPEQIKCAIDHLESEKNASSLWSALANDLDELNGEPKRSVTFWKRTFKRIIKRLTAKRELYEHISRNYVKMGRTSCTLTKLERHLLSAWMQSKVMNTTNTEWTEPSYVASTAADFISNCRICLASTSSKMTHLFDNNDDDHDRITLLDKLNYCSCLSSSAHIDDGFPQYICMSCSVLLESAYQLKLLCAKTEEKLKEIRGKSKRARRVVEEPSFELNDEFIIEEVDAKPGNADSGLTESSHIE